MHENVILIHFPSVEIGHCFADKTKDIISSFSYCLCNCADSLNKAQPSRTSSPVTFLSPKYQSP